MAILQFTCRICNTICNHPTFIGREMMFGTREEFEYFKCTDCGCLQITDIPHDLGRFYPPHYYSLTDTNSNHVTPLKALLVKQRFRNAVFGRGYKLNRILSNWIKIPDLRVDTVLSVAGILQKAAIHNFSARFLDIGCGSSSLWLASLRTMGFRHLFGADPFINSDVNCDDITIFKRQVNEMTGAFDLITFHHSLEHIPDQEAALTSAYDLLAQNGVILVRIPIVSSRVWEKYKTNWVEFDPPRHLFLHSIKSLKILANKAGLEVFGIQHDSTAFEFYGSEMYTHGIPLIHENSPWVNHKSTLFSREEMDSFGMQAGKANKEGQGGRAAFFLRRLVA